MSACFCIGPQRGEPVCPCLMAAEPRLTALAEQWKGSKSLAAAQAYINGLVFELKAARALLTKEK